MAIYKCDQCGSKCKGGYCSKCDKFVLTEYVRPKPIVKPKKTKVDCKKMKHKTVHSLRFAAAGMIIDLKIETPLYMYACPKCEYLHLTKQAGENKIAFKKQSTLIRYVQMIFSIREKKWVLRVKR